MVFENAVSLLEISGLFLTILIGLIVLTVRFYITEDIGDESNKQLVIASQIVAGLMLFLSSASAIFAAVLSEPFGIPIALGLIFVGLGAMTYGIVRLGIDALQTEDEKHLSGSRSYTLDKYREESTEEREK